MDTINGAYLAGVWDSDGSFTITKRHPKRSSPNFTIMAQLTWVLNDNSREFMQTLVETYGGSCFEGESPSGFDNGRRIIKYCATGNAAASLLTAMYPYLVLKKEQAANLLAARSVMRPGHRLPEATKKLEALYEANKILNSKNGKSHYKTKGSLHEGC